jgi:hypothetical protein
MTRWYDYVVSAFFIATVFAGYFWFRRTVLIALLCVAILGLVWVFAQVSVEVRGGS